MYYNISTKINNHLKHKVKLYDVYSQIYQVYKQSLQLVEVYIHAASEEVYHNVHT